MIRFECDYAEGAHPRIMERLAQTNSEQTEGYGTDPYCRDAALLIKNLCGGGQSGREADVHFLVGGTQTNKTVIAAALLPYQGVIAAETGHINVHESGAIEATGHKVLALPTADGKLTAAQIQNYLDAYWEDGNHVHVVQPAMVYISNPTECGTIYTKEELQALYKVCSNAKVMLFIDGARLGYGLAAVGNNLTMPDITANCDVFSIGATKVGALFGEAVVITHERLKGESFRYMMKQHGGMLAKGRLLGVQFKTLFEDGLYFEISRHAVGQAMRIRDAFGAKGVAFLHESPTNQQFPILTQTQRDVLSQKYAFELWKPIDSERAAVRFCTGWATREQDTDALIADIEKL